MLKGRISFGAETTWLMVCFLTLLDVKRIEKRLWPSSGHRRFRKFEGYRTMELL